MLFMPKEVKFFDLFDAQAAIVMECASLFAVSYFRCTNLFQFFYAADNLDTAKWDKRSLGNDDKLSEKEI